jgi:hypothetical protein
MSVSEAQAQEDDLKSTEDIQSVDVVDEGPPDETDTGALTKKLKDKEPAHRERELGKSLLPFSRVQKIIKADKVRFKRTIINGYTVSSSTLGTSNNCTRRDVLDLACH